MPYVKHSVNQSPPTNLPKTTTHLNILNLLPTPIRRGTELLPRTPSLLRGDLTAPALRHPPRPIGLVVVDEQLALLAVTPRHFVRDFDDGESALPAVHGAEDVVHLFKRTASGLWL